MQQIIHKFTLLTARNGLKNTKKNEDFYLPDPQDHLPKKLNQPKQPTLHTILVVLLGTLLGFSTAVWLRSNLIGSCSNSRQCCPRSALLNQILHEQSLKQVTENVNIFREIEPDKSLVFIGVMTAQKYLDTRARAVYETWGKNIPGRISFFSRAGSSTKYNIPLVSLAGVDDVILKFILIFWEFLFLIINNSKLAISSFGRLYLGYSTILKNMFFMTI